MKRTIIVAFALIASSQAFAWDDYYAESRSRTDAIFDRNARDIDETAAHIRAPSRSYDEPVSTGCTFNCPTYYNKADGDRGVMYTTPLY